MEIMNYYAQAYQQYTTITIPTMTGSEDKIVLTFGNTDSDEVCGSLHFEEKAKDISKVQSATTLANSDLFRASRPEIEGDIARIVAQFFKNDKDVMLGPLLETIGGIQREIDQFYIPLCEAISEKAEADDFRRGLRKIYAPNAYPAACARHQASMADSSVDVLPFAVEPDFKGYGEGSLHYMKFRILADRIKAAIYAAFPPP